MARGRFDAAVAQLRELDRAKRAAGVHDPRLYAHAAELVEALVGAGELDETAEVLGRFEAEAQTSASPWSIGAAARCRALLLAAQGRLEEAHGAAERSVSCLDSLPMPFERARSLFVLGQIRRRRKEKRPAQQALSQALATFEALGTPVWAGRARAELARIPQGQAADGLTPTEETIARLAGAGLTNREIADRVFLSPKTVEVNLTRIYRKLGVRSRAALASRFAGQEAAAQGVIHPS
jgi:DNA-binding CsgD family transcriptional regulator